MKQFVRDYLTFNKRERNGVFVLLSAIILLIVYLNISHYLIKEETVDFTTFEKETTLLQASVAPQTDNLKEHPEKKEFSKTAFERFHFNPNNLPVAEWKRLGLTDKQIHTIKNYEAKGGTFRTKEDVRKIYGISEKMYASLAHFISIPEKETLVNTPPGSSHLNNQSSIIEINSADSVQLARLKGIGAFYAKTIVKYRHLLGGFVSKEQLMEVWKLDQEKFDEIKGQVTVDNSKIKKINVNSCSASELKHPYLKWNVVNAILNYRGKHGKYKTIEDIKKTDVVDDETYIKIAPYLVVEY